VNASRAITHNAGVQEATSPKTAEQAMVAAIDRAKQELADI
jgi:flavin-binding protein dodecin